MDGKQSNQEQMLRLDDAKNAARKLLAGVRIVITDEWGEYREDLKALSLGLKEGGNQGVLRVFDALKRVSPWLNELQAGEDPYPDEYDNDRLASLMRYELSDFGQAEALTAMYGSRLRYVPGLGWYVWTGKRWQQDRQQAVYQYAMMTSRVRARAGLEAIEQAEGKEAQKKAMRNLQWLLNRRNYAAVEKMLKAAATMPYFVMQADELDANPMLMGVRNGTVDLRTGELLPHDPVHNITKRTDIDYFADAPASRWERFLLEIFGENAGLVDYVQRAVGYSLTGVTSEQCFWVLHGSGANGKSTFLDILREVIGEYGSGTPFNTFLYGKQSNAGDDLARLRGVRLVTASESGDGARLNEDRIKAVTGGDEITARHLYGSFFSFKPQFHIWLATNHKPVIVGTDTGIWRRVRLVPFNVSFSGRADLGLMDKLRSELPGILAWAVRGCLKWQQRGLSMDEATQGATEGYRDEMDVLGNFLKECCERGEDFKVSAKELYQAYKTWANENGLHNISQIRFSRALQERGYEKYRPGGVYHWKELQLSGD